MLDQKHYRSRGAKAALQNSPLSLLLITLLATSAFIPASAEESASSSAGDASSAGKDTRASAEDARALDRAAKALVKDARASAKRVKDPATGASAKDAEDSTKSTEASGKDADSATKEAKTSAKEAKTPAGEAKSPAKGAQTSISNRSSQVIKAVSVRVAGCALGFLGGMPVCWYKRAITDEVQGVHDMTETKSHSRLVAAGIFYLPFAAMASTFEMPVYAMHNAILSRPFSKEQFSLSGD